MGILAILKNGILITRRKVGIVEARMRTQEVQPICLWALATSEAGKPASVYVIGVYPGGRPKGKSCLENH